MIKEIYKNAESIEEIDTDDKLKIYDCFLQNETALYSKIQKDCLDNHAMDSCCCDAEDAFDCWLYEDNGCCDGEFPLDILASMLKHIAELENWESELLAKITAEADEIIKSEYSKASVRAFSEYGDDANEYYG